MKAWADEQNFREYDPEWINEQLKKIAYKKTKRSEIERCWLEMKKGQWKKRAVKQE